MPDFWVSLVQTRLCQIINIKIVDINNDCWFSVTNQDGDSVAGIHQNYIVYGLLFSIAVNSYLNEIGYISEDVSHILAQF